MERHCRPATEGRIDFEIYVSSANEGIYCAIGMLGQIKKFDAKHVDNWELICKEKSVCISSHELWWSAPIDLQPRLCTTGELTEQKVKKSTPRLGKNTVFQQKSTPWERRVTCQITPSANMVALFPMFLVILLINK